MIRNAKDLSPGERAAIESILGRQVLEEEAISIRAIPPIPDWLQRAWEGAQKRGLDRLTPDDIQNEINAYRGEKRESVSEDQR